MNSKRGNSRWPWLLACGLGLITFYADAMWSASVDLAHHYALVYRLGEQWGLAGPADPSLGEMNVYPRGAHLIAALLGKLAGSPFAGLQITALLGLVAIWAGILFVLQSLKQPLARLSIVLFVVLMAINASTLKLDLHGRELVESYFFSQIFGNGVMFISVAVALECEHKSGPLKAMSVLCLLTFLNEWIHLLPAIEMLGLICGLAITDTFIEWRKSKAFTLRLFAGTAISLVAIAGTVAHPSFGAMLSISINPGGLEMRHLAYPASYIALSLIVLALSGALLLNWFIDTTRQENIAAKYLAWIGIASAGACLTQFTLTWFGMGSDYAVKKYAFGLTTIALVLGAVLTAMSIFKAKWASRPLSFAQGSLVNGLILSVALVVSFSINVPARKSLDVSEVVAVERRLTAMSDTVIPAPPEDKYAVVVGINEMPYTLNYMFALAIFKVPRALLTELLSNNRLTDVSHFSSIVTSPSNPNYVGDSCVGQTAAHFIVVDGKCLSYRSLEFDTAAFRIKPRAVLTPANFSPFGPANFIPERGLIQSDTFVDAGYSSEEIYLPAGRYKLDAVFDWDVESENVALHAGHLSLHGNRILVPITTSSVSDMEVSTVFVTEGKPIRIAFGLGGWSTGRGAIELKSMSISEVVPVAAE